VDADSRVGELVESVYQRVLGINTLLIDYCRCFGQRRRRRCFTINSALGLKAIKKWTAACRIELSPSFI